MHLFAIPSSLCLECNMQKLLLIVCLLCTGCYAQSMHIAQDSPWGIQQPGLQLQFSDPDTPLSLHSQRILERYFGPNPQQSPWQLTLSLKQQQKTHQSPQIMGWLTPSPRIRMEITAEGTLQHLQKHTTYRWTVQGDTVSGQEETLKALLLERLGAKIYEELGPRYVYQ